MAAVCLTGVGLLVLAVALWPTESQVTPNWEIWVVDEAGNGVAGTKIMMQWEDVTLRRHRRFFTSLTDERGYISLPPQTFRATALGRLVGEARTTFRERGRKPRYRAMVLAVLTDSSGRALASSERIGWSETSPHMQSRVVLRRHEPLYIIPKPPN